MRDFVKILGFLVGRCVGAVGTGVGEWEGTNVGCAVGRDVGCWVGRGVGWRVGRGVGGGVGSCVGRVGSGEGTGDGCRVDKRTWTHIETISLSPSVARIN